MSYLIFVNELGPNYKGDNIYEFIFSDDLEGVWGDSWESKPSNGYPLPPDLEHIMTEHERKVIQRFLQNHEKNSLIRSLHRYAKKYVIQDESDLKLMKQFIVEYVRAEK